MVEDFDLSEHLARSRQCRLLNRVSVGVYSKRVQSDQEVPVSAPSPVHRFSWGMFQYAFRQLRIEIDEQRPMNEKRLPTPGLRVPRDLSVADRHVRCSFRPADYSEGREDRTNQIGARTKTGLRVQVCGSGRYQRVVQHAGGLEHGTSAGGPLEHIYSQPGARVGVHYLFRPLAGAHDHGWRPSPPEAQPTEPRRRRRACRSVVDGEITGYGRG